MAENFFALGIRREINDALKEQGITNPTPVQIQVIPLILEGKDVAVQAQTGTGKTLAFLLPLLERVKPSDNSIQALIITPTRELAAQITRETTKLAAILGLTVLPIYGGQNVERQIKKLKGHPQIVIGTPGRLLDHVRRKTIKLARVSKLVLDEADQMLNMGFLAEVEELIKLTWGNRQTMLFSATMPQKVRALAARYMKKPVQIAIKSQHVTLDEIQQLIIEVAEDDKLEKLCSLIDEHNPYLSIVFCHTRERASLLNTALIQRGYLADELHGDLSQAKRTQVMKRFASAKLQILVATDIAARGLDIEGVTHIFNYDIPHDAESYIHRIGRTGRAGQTGMAITFVTPEERSYLRLIEKGIRYSLDKYKAYGSKITPKPKKAVVIAQAKLPPRLHAAKAAALRKKHHGGLNQRSRRKQAAGR